LVLKVHLCSVSEVGLKRKQFYSFSRKAKIKRKWASFREISFRENFRFRESFRFRENFSFSRKFSFLHKFSQKNSFLRNFSHNFCAKTTNFRKNFRLRFKGKFFCDRLPRKFYLLTSILVHVYGYRYRYCLIYFETLSGFDHPFGYLYNKTAVSFVLKQYPDLLVLITQYR
jgi:hypothetical protein